jgi:ferredoxin
MPRGDGTGPMGKGPFTGRGMGRCGDGIGMGHGRGRGCGICVGRCPRSAISLAEANE